MEIHTENSFVKEKAIFDTLLSDLQSKSDDHVNNLNELENVSKLIQKCSNKLHPYLKEIKHEEISIYIDNNIECAKKLNAYFQKRLCLIKNSQKIDIKLNFELFDVKKLFTDFYKKFPEDEKLLAIGKLKQLVQKLKDNGNLSQIKEGNYKFNTIHSGVIYDSSKEIINCLITNQSIADSFIKLISTKENEIKNEYSKDKYKNWKQLVLNSTNPKINDSTQFLEFVKKNIYNPTTHSLGKKIYFSYIYVHIEMPNKAHALADNFEDIFYIILFDFFNKNIQIFSKFTQKLPVSFKLISCLTDPENNSIVNLVDYTKYILVEDDDDNSDVKLNIDLKKVFKDLKLEINSIKLFEDFSICVYSENAQEKITEILKENKTKVIMTNNSKVIHQALNKDKILNSWVILQEDAVSLSEIEEVYNRLDRDDKE